MEKRIIKIIRYSLSTIILTVLFYWVGLGQYYLFFYGRNGVVTDVYKSEDNLFYIDVELRDGLKVGPILIDPEFNIKQGDIYKENTWEFISLYSADKQIYIYIAGIFNIMSLGVIIAFLVLFLKGHFEEDEDY